MTDKLDVMDVKEPCTEPWEGMKGDARTRHCERCRLSVYNLSAMTREEAQSVLRREWPRNIRFIRRADGTVLTRDCAPLRSPRLVSVPADPMPATGIPRVDLRAIPPDPDALLYISKRTAQQLGVFPLRWGGGVAVIAVSKPPSLSLLHDLRFLTQSEVEFVLVEERELREAIEREYPEEEPVYRGGEPLRDED